MQVRHLNPLSLSPPLSKIAQLTRYARAAPSRVQRDDLNLRYTVLRCCVGACYTSTTFCFPPNLPYRYHGRSLGFCVRPTPLAASHDIPFTRLDLCCANDPEHCDSPAELLLPGLRTPFECGYWETLSSKKTPISVSG